MMLLSSQRLPKSKKSPEQLIVFLHGYGTNSETLINIADHWCDLLPDAEFVAPNGLERSESPSSGYQWFRWINFDAVNVRPGLEMAAPIVAKILTQWLNDRNLTEKQLALVGFSQGAMLSLELMFHLPNVRSIIAYSGAFYPPPVSHLRHHQSPKILLVHGDADTSVPYAAFIEAGHQLIQLGVKPSLYPCPGLGHHIDRKGIDRAGSFLQQCFL